MIYGYARVSTTTQGRDGNSLEEQVTALRSYGCQEIIQEAFSGKTMERPAFQALLNRLQPNDILVVTKLDRFARTAIEGVKTVRELFERGVKVPNLDTFVSIANALEVSADYLLQDVVDKSCEIESSELSTLISEQSPEMRRKIYRAVRALVDQ